jgi:hypothetical protein
MARLIAERGGDFRQVAAAACLAGPAAFSAQPDGRLDKRVVAFAGEIMAFEEDPSCILSADARLFLQASAILLLEGMAREKNCTTAELQKSYAQALELYSLARGSRDLYRMDTLFEIAAMKATTLLEKGNHLWVRFRAPQEVFA